MASDEAFEKFREEGKECFDIIFIDGLHEAQQVDGKGRGRGEGERAGQGDRDMQIGLTLLHMCMHRLSLCVFVFVFVFGCAGARAHVRACVRASERIV